MKETKHTPLLVSMVRSDEFCDVLTADGQIFCRVADETVAHHIVRACNSHEALVEACEALRKSLRDCYARFSGDWTENDSAGYEQAGKALAKASSPEQE